MNIYVNRKKSIIYVEYSRVGREVIPRSLFSVSYYSKGKALQTVIVLLIYVLQIPNVLMRKRFRIQLLFWYGSSSEPAKSQKLPFLSPICLPLIVTYCSLRQIKQQKNARPFFKYSLTFLSRRFLGSGSRTGVDRPLIWIRLRQKIKPVWIRKNPQTRSLNARMGLILTSSETKP